MSRAAEEGYPGALFSKPVFLPHGFSTFMAAGTQSGFIPAGSEPGGRRPGSLLDLVPARLFGERREDKRPVGANTLPPGVLPVCYPLHAAGIRW